MKPPEIIAELSCNHGGSLTRALDLVDAAAMAGADGIKVQCWHPDRMLPVGYQGLLTEGPWAGKPIRELYREAHTPWHWIPAIFARAKEYNLACIASVFDTDALQYLEDINCPRYKIASFELVDLSLIEAVAATGKPIILSTGMADDQEIWQAVKVAGKYASPPRDITLLHCVSAYPAPPITMDLEQIILKEDTYGCPTGLSDHSTGTVVAIAAAAFGASMIEKHFILDRREGGPDAAFSIEPHELTQLVRDVRIAWEASTHHSPMTACEDPQRALRRSLYWAKDMGKGEIAVAKDMTTARPAHGLKPADAHLVIGKTLRVPCSQGDPVRVDQIN